MRLIIYELQKTELILFAEASTSEIKLAKLA